MDALDRVTGARNRSHSVRDALESNSSVPKVPRLEWYTEHNEIVRQFVDEERLLEYNVKQGWEPLCKFLGREVPNVTFPHVNNADTFRGVLGREFRVQEERFKRLLGAMGVAAVAGVVAIRVYLY